MTRARAAGLALVGLVAAAALQDATVAIARFDRLAPVGPGRATPRFEVELLDGGRFSDASLPGRVHVVSFWASWCGYCRNELAQIDRELLERYDAAAVSFIAVNREGGGMAPDDARALARQYRGQTGMRVPIAIDGGAMARAFGVGPIPHTAVFDRAGKLRHVHQGLVDADRLADEIDDLLAE
jgi:thiol-disulfide isomerase/thioredoxin